MSTKKKMISVKVWAEDCLIIMIKKTLNHYIGLNLTCKQ